MNNYELQTNTPIYKPIHYRIGEFLALKHFFALENKEKSILDVGCGCGDAVGILNKMGYRDVIGFDLNPKKTRIGRELGYNVCTKDVLELTPSYEVDYIWCSHTFEHFPEPERSLALMRDMLAYNGEIIFILPYPDTDPNPAHCASSIIGLDVVGADKVDSGETVMRWFQKRGLTYKEHKFDVYREPEIWIRMEKT